MAFPAGSHATPVEVLHLGLDRHGGSPRPRETWGGASGMGIGGRDFAPVEYPWHG